MSQPFVGPRMTPNVRYMSQAPVASCQKPMSLSPFGRSLNRVGISVR
jgi:hypothetical protein